MLLQMHKKIKYLLSLFACFFLVSLPSARAAGPPAPSLFSNSLAVVLIIIMVILLIIIGILASVLIGAADLKLRKRKKEGSVPVMTAPLLLFFLLLSGSSLFAQDASPAVTTVVASTIGGMPSSVFYVMATVVFLELAIIIGMLINIRILIKTEKEKLLAASKEETEAIKKTRLSWWDRFNKLRPVTQEAELDLGHEYDGIRELNNKLPPWWLYGFYLTIIFAGVYLWRFHVSHEGPSSKEEYERSVVQADLEIKSYLKSKGETVDENTVTLLTTPEDIEEGKSIFIKSCASCHQETGAGNVGPNLTDDFWLHGNDIKSVFKTVRYGINAMPQWQNSYSNKQLAQVASYVKSLRGTNPSNPKAPQGTEMKEETASSKKVADSLKVKDSKANMNL